MSKSNWNLWMTVSLSGLLLITLPGYGRGTLSVQMTQRAMQPRHSSQFHKGTHLEKGDEYFQAGQYGEAIGEYKRMLSQDPSLGQARFALGMAYACSGKEEKAFKTWEKLTVSSSDSNNTEIMNEVQKLQALRQDTSQFQEALRKYCTVGQH